ncbi:hypothetical protein L593_09010 [Salinarchaeum sp. Harcht-Bsk1]|uniref:DUF7858 family protein n=1 Tax=Salinarchaeum sp. Harcht-Bsk1 TaxID=1333523 RepID=UPI0003424460|nr:hypothetical protein [Salinarchaeum sp. Harcht-Bsk1]AGN01747.1 hypothetical protein L593_09010 [Salinarchaeum sp. Harcht-Bsk1]
MGLSDIAADLEVTAEQRDRGVATVDETDGDLAERLVPVAEDLPCSAAAAADLVDAYADGASVGGAGKAAGLPPITAAKVLHLVGVDGVCPLAPVAREIVTDWIAGDLPRTEARELAGASETEFLLTTFLETHEPIPAAREAVEPVLGPGDAPLSTDDALAETMADAGEFL